MNTALVMTNTPGLKRAQKRTETHERDALRTRICILEAALSSIARETALATRVPEVSFLAIHRIASVTRQTIGDAGEDEES